MAAKKGDSTRLKTAKEHRKEVGAPPDDFSVVILAAGKASRFKSEHSKMLHRLAGRPLGEYALRAASGAGPDHIYMVIGHESAEVRQAFERPGLTFIEQTEQRGTGHAILTARVGLEQCASANIAVLVGDAPLLDSETVRLLVKNHAETGAAATVLSTVLANPSGYGRVVRDRANRVLGIVEERICTPAQRRIREVNSGTICFSRGQLLAHLDELSADNAQKEYLITDMLEILRRHRLKVTAYQAKNSHEVLGVNNRVELSRIEMLLRQRKTEALMLDGVTISNPATVTIDPDVEVGADTIIEPGVSLLGNTRVGRGCWIRTHSTIADSVIGDAVTIRPCCVVAGSELGPGVMLGPFAHLREGTVLESGSRIGNFVEVKKSRVGRGSKAQHLSYLGDAWVGEMVNVGAGTVTCNYDGEKKHPTEIGDGAFIGSGSMLVAPVRIGKGAYVAAGSTITEEVPPESLGIARARQMNAEGWARARKARKQADAKPRT
jgi:bifunctional UDP-N-acetylglucosamine pyrophosphorylase / glucosamine-1-phosphate N-acetyltransferase